MLTGVAGADALLVDVPPASPSLEIVFREAAGPGPAGDRVSDDRVQLRLRTGGWVDLQRSPSRAVFHLAARPEDGALVHPYLAPVAAMAARWLQRDSFHAGAVVIDGGVWAFVGDKGSGKSSTLAHLALAGYDVFTDDMLIIERDDAVAGPRCIDLRPGPAARFGIGTSLGVVGQRERWRMPLPQLPVAQLPMRGWVILGWAERIEVVPVRGAQRLMALERHRAVRLPARDPRAVLSLSSLPVVELRRPQRWAALAETADRLLGAIAQIRR